MSQLAVVALVMGVLILLWHMLLIGCPMKAAAWMTEFPRSIWPGRILAGVDVTWIAVLVLRANINLIDRNQFLVMVLAPIVFMLIIVFMDELLSVRALGGLFLLVPQLILNTAFVHPSNARIVMNVFAYFLVILGIIWIWSPFMFRKMSSGWISNPFIVRIVGGAGCVVGLLMIVLGMIVY